MNKNKGFTLIELLVVIAIIGILASIVLASLNTARQKAADSKIKGQLSNLRAAAEMYYTAQLSYGPAANDNCALMKADPTVGFGNIFAGTTGIVCNAVTNSWAASAQYISDSTKYWCVDSSGASKETTSGVGTNTVCPAS